MLNICGIIAFFMMYIYDLNLIYLGNKFLKVFCDWVNNISICYFSEYYYLFS